MKSLNPPSSNPSDPKVGRVASSLAGKTTAPLAGKAPPPLAGAEKLNPVKAGQTTSTEQKNPFGKSAFFSTKTSSMPEKIAATLKAPKAVMAENSARALLGGLARLALPASLSSTSLTDGWNNLAEFLRQADGPNSREQNNKFLTQYLPRTHDNNLSAKLWRYAGFLKEGQLARVIEGELLSSTRQTTALKQQAQLIRSDITAITKYADVPFTDTSGQEWRLFLIPLWQDHHIVHLRLYVAWRRDKKRRQEKQAEKRFVIETSFSALGPIQLDMMQVEKQIKIIFRTHQKISDELQTGIGQIFSESLALMAAGGDIVFHKLASFPVTPPPGEKLPDEGLYI